MPYPFVQCPTFAELKEKLRQEYGCQIRDGGELTSDDGSSPITYLERVVDGKSLTYVIVIDDDETRIEVDLIRGICDRLQIPKADFGLTLE